MTCRLSAVSVHTSPATTLQQYNALRLHIARMSDTLGKALDHKRAVQDECDLMRERLSEANRTLATMSVKHITTGAASSGTYPSVGGRAAVAMPITGSSPVAATTTGSQCGGGSGVALAPPGGCGAGAMTPTGCPPSAATPTSASQGG